MIGKRHLTLLGIVVLAAAAAVGTMFAIEDRWDRAMTAELDAT